MSLNIKYKALTSQKNHKGTSCRSMVGQMILNFTLEAQSLKWKSVNYTKFSNFCFSEVPNKKMSRWPIEQGGMFANHMYFLKKYKCPHNHKKANHPIRVHAKDIKRHFTKENIQRSIKT